MTNPGGGVVEGRRAACAPSVLQNRPRYNGASDQVQSEDSRLDNPVVPRSDTTIQTGLRRSTRCSMSHDEQRVGQFYRYLARWFVLRQSVGAITLWAFLWGTAILILKATQGTSVPTLLWGA